ncbi:AbrB/MazE/SpoVT family DNA-binding domain-containing protein [Pseudomonas mangiferae]|uniref:AbrB/MazE/SpoVT family DNA-binding domain-containing protein n=1 Tax=Pseudomonas mangiferae TaxID=2593654 RepID=A0A553H3T0_9PSED|nr:AbrB/MazE/SpoVT family DNA-binding domain-containing protein [Pseudomonas mangiferae]
MGESSRTAVKCEDPGDGSGDMIVDLPPEILEAMNLRIGDSLSIEVEQGIIVLKPIRNTGSRKAVFSSD